MVGADTLGWHAPYALVHHAEEAVPNAVLAWFVNTGLSAVAGALVGAVIVLVMHLIPRKKAHGQDHH